ncbi:hypothetical protein [Streptomyces sp. NPDC006285]|uniref:hypothetical protein n=1 Tax=Streptomyces sp. NPDC006285 TaxID=3364742 RepID=UPI0036C515BF
MVGARVPGHIPNAELAVRALDGNRSVWSASAARHLARCGVCRDQLTAYERVVAAGRLTRPGQVLLDPPRGVWAAVRTGLAADSRRTTPSGRPHARTLLALRRAGSHVLRGSAAVVRAAARLHARLRPHRPHRPRGPHG